MAGLNRKGRRPIEVGYSLLSPVRWIEAVDAAGSAWRIRPDNRGGTAPCPLAVGRPGHFRRLAPDRHACIRLAVPI